MHLSGAARLTTIASCPSPPHTHTHVCAPAPRYHALGVTEHAPGPAVAKALRGMDAATRGRLHTQLLAAGGNVRAVRALLALYLPPGLEPASTFGAGMQVSGACTR